MSFGIACGGSTAPPTMAAERTAWVAQPCTTLELGAEPLDAGKARVFIEVAEVDTRALPQPVDHWLAHNAVKVRSSVNLVAFPNVPTSMPWGQCVDAVCTSKQHAIAITAGLSKLASDPIELALRIDEPAPDGSGGEPRILLDTTLRAVNQVPNVLPPAPEVSDGSVVVTAYLLRRHDDLQRILECQAKLGEKVGDSR
jgi:hypothetical protein